MRAEGPYRDAGPGIQARLAELRATWSREAELSLAHHSQVIRAESANLARAQWLTWAQVLLVAFSLAFWLGHRQTPGVAYDRMPLGVFDLTYLALVLGLVARVSRRARLTGMARAQAIVATATPGGGSAEIERLTHESPEALLATHLRRLVVERRAWSLVVRGLALVTLPLVITAQDVPMAVADATLVAVFALALLGLALIIAIDRRIVSSWRGLVLAVTGFVIFVLSCFFGANTCLVLLLQAAVLLRQLITP